MDLQSYLKERASLIDATLQSLLPQETLYPHVVHQAMRYSVFAGGKRLRPILCLAGAEAVGGDITRLLPIACALEMIHTYSLIHDDLPAMDNDDYRRGKLTNHKVYGEGIAILTGDALLTLAFEVMAGYGNTHFNAKSVLRVISEIASASGTLGMIGGQVVDLQSEGKNIDEKTLVYIHSHKTGALFRASLRAGALLFEAEPVYLEALTNYAEYFGLAFQITDDILDVVGEESKLGKPVGSDTRNQKATYPVLYGLEQSRKLAKEAVEKAIASLKPLPGETKPLELLARYLYERET